MWRSVWITKLQAQTKKGLNQQKNTILVTQFQKLSYRLPDKDTFLSGRHLIYDAKLITVPTRTAPHTVKINVTNMLQVRTD